MQPAIARVDAGEQTEHAAVGVGARLGASAKLRVKIVEMNFAGFLATIRGLGAQPQRTDVMATVERERAGGIVGVDSGKHAAADVARRDIGAGNSWYSKQDDDRETHGRRIRKACASGN